MATLGNSKMVFLSTEMSANMTAENHLGYMLQEKPYEAAKIIDTMFSAKNLYSNNPLTSGLFGNVPRETISSTEWEWKTKGSDSRPLMVVKSSITDNVVGRQTVKIAFEKDWFVYGDVLRPLDAPTFVQYRVIRGPEALAGGQYEYLLEPMWDDENRVIPANLFSVGSYWNRLYSLYGEAADKRGSITFGGTLAFRNRMSLLAKKYEITDLASLKVLTTALPDPDTGKPVARWALYADIVFMRTFKQEEEATLWFSRSTSKVLDNTGFPVKSGAGIEEQIEDGFTYYVNRLNYRLLEDYLMNVFYGRVAPDESRNVKVGTGEYGLLELSRVGKDMIEKSGFALSIETIAKKTKSPYNSNAYEAGYQITKLNLGNNMSIEMIHNPIFDNKDMFTQIDPITGKPAKSLEMVFIDFKNSAKPNVVIKDLKGGFSFGYYEGLYSPLGPKRRGQMSHTKAAYEIHMQRYLGVQITDVTATGKIAPNVWMIV